MNAEQQIVFESPIQTDRPDGRLRGRALRARANSLRPLVRLCAVICVCSAVWAVSRGEVACGQEGFISRQPEIEAAYLYNFGKYVTWPADQDASKPFVIAVVGESPIQEPLVRLARAKSLNDRPIVVKQFRAAADYEPCQILFVADGQNRDLVAEIVGRARSMPTLVVGETRKAIDGGGMISFYPEGNTLKFEINPLSAERVRLKISSKLLALGKTVGS
jgi:hypothetical protein